MKKRNNVYYLFLFLFITQLLFYFVCRWSGEYTNRDLANMILVTNILIYLCFERLS